MGGKVFQHVVPPAAVGRALLSAMPSDSQAPRSLTWVVLTFTALFQASRTPPFCFLGKNRKSCLQLFPALWTKELLQAWRHTHTHTLTHNIQFTHILFLRVSPQPRFRMPLTDVEMTPGMMGWRQKHVCFPFQDKTTACTQDSHVEKCRCEDVAAYRYFYTDTHRRPFAIWYNIKGLLLLSTPWSLSESADVS